MSDSDKEGDPPHLARYREYKRRQAAKKQKSNSMCAHDPAPPSDPSPPQTTLKRVANHHLTLPLLKLFLWLLLLCLAAHHQFGSVFFLGSIPVLVWTSMEEYKRGPRELSAYSVFNENHEVLDGTFTSEQWERELKYGPGAVMKHD